MHGCSVRFGGLASQAARERSFFHDAGTGDDITYLVLMKIIRAQANHG